MKIPLKYGIPLLIGLWVGASYTPYGEGKTLLLMLAMGVALWTAFSLPHPGPRERPPPEENDEDPPLEGDFPPRRKGRKATPEARPLAEPEKPPPINGSGEPPANGSGQGTP